MLQHEHIPLASNCQQHKCIYFFRKECTWHVHCNTDCNTHADIQHTCMHSFQIVQLTFMLPARTTATRSATTTATTSATHCNTHIDYNTCAFTTTATTATRILTTPHVHSNLNNRVDLAKLSSAAFAIWISATSPSFRT